MLRYVIDRIEVRGRPCAVRNDDPAGAAAGLRTSFGSRPSSRRGWRRRPSRYLRRLQGAPAPAAPGTVLAPDGEVELTGVGRPGAAVALPLEIENRQRVHTASSPRARRRSSAPTA